MRTRWQSPRSDRQEEAGSYPKMPAKTRIFCVCFQDRKLTGNGLGRKTTQSDSRKFHDMNNRATVFDVLVVPADFYRPNARHYDAGNSLDFWFVMSITVRRINFPTDSTAHGRKQIKCANRRSPSSTRNSSTPPRPCLFVRCCC